MSILVSLCLVLLTLMCLIVRNIDPVLAANLLEQIESGAEMEPILIQLKNACPTREARDSGTGSVRDGHVTQVNRSRDKMVTFQEDFSVQNM